MLSINAIYSDYVRVSADKNLPTLSSSMYRNIFTSDFNIGFGCPRSDTCSRCEVIACKDDLLRHKKNAEEAFSSQRIDRDEVLVLVLESQVLVLVLVLMV